ncbi:histone-lysine N-methyltransferase SETMAR-like protein [Plakobranchus ocellatus]|uniref:Histone-lysine N-methyltransferase SETMAR-like protein n=1 Tax=Plakobranchus ocellatus TaxID=259542 RepID=A0AAV3XX97_9GAST|nr:histone-lysine N-methyltransferase SETMAR-like protein [Plakobranchus ocellatus]
MLSGERKVQRKAVCAELLKRYEEDAETFMQQIVTGDESWVCRYNTADKRQPKQYTHKSLLSSKRYKVAASARKGGSTFS